MPDHASYMGRKTFGSLDGFRCASILAVLWHHASGGLELGRLGTRGFLGVDMFFVLSGFLIVTLLLREQARRQTISLRAFYLRRVLRIFPLYYGVVLGTVLLVAVVRPGGKVAQSLWQDLPYLLTYTTNWAYHGTLLGITWSLAAEEQFYLLWPPIQKFVPRPTWVLLVLVGLSQWIHFGLADGLLASLGAGPNDLPMLRQTTFTPILLGVLLAHLLHSPVGFARVSALVGSRWAAPVLLSVLLVLLELLPQDLRGWPRLTIHLLLFALLASCVVREDHALSGLLRWPPVMRIGAVSYGMYLLHMFVVDAAARLTALGMPRELTFPLTLAGTLLLAELSFRYYETPFLRLKRRFAR